MIHIRLDDGVYARETLEEICGVEFRPLEQAIQDKANGDIQNKNYFKVSRLGKGIDHPRDAFELMRDTGSVLVYANIVQPHLEMLDLGPVAAPASLIKKHLEMQYDKDKTKQILGTMGGLTLKDAFNILSITKARDNDKVEPEGLVKTRRALIKTTKGLSIIDTYMPVYCPDKQIADFIIKEKQQFLFGPDPRLRARGLLLDGIPGVGKTAAAKHIARQWGIPLFRLAATFQDKWLGNCHSADTEYLTNHGIKKHYDVSDDDLLGTVNLKTGALQFQKPTNKIWHRFSGKMVRLKAKQADALLTPDHRMWVASTRSKPLFEFVTAESLLKIKEQAHRQILSAPIGWTGDQIKYFEVPRIKARGVRPTTPRIFSANKFLRFLGYFVSEGSTDADRSVVRLHQNAGPILEDMSDVMNELFPVVHRIETRGCYQLCGSNRHLWNWLRIECGTHSYNKRLPRWVLRLSEGQIQIVVSAMIDGDGSLPRLGRSGSFIYHSTSKVLSEQLVEMALRLGFYVNSTEKPEKDNCRRQYVVSCSPMVRRWVSRKNFGEESYDGYVGCFKVPNGTLLTRRNGKWLVSGDSGVGNYDFS